MKARAVTYNWHDAETSFTEAVLSRGDRRVGDLIEAIWRRGGYLESWSEGFALSRWTDSAAELGMDLTFYANRERALCELLPLDLREVRSLRVHYESETAAQLTAKIQSIRAFRDITSPMKQTAAGWIPDFGSRYFTADFPFGLKIIRDVGALAGLPMPNINRLWSWYEQTARLPGVACFRLDADSLDSLIRLYA